MRMAEPYTIFTRFLRAPRRFCEAAWQAARGPEGTPLTGASGGLPTRRRLPACPTKRGSNAIVGFRSAALCHDLQESFEAGGEFHRVEGLDHVVVGAEFEAAENIALVLAGGQHNHLQREFRLAYGGEHFEAVHTGHIHVEH